MTLFRACPLFRAFLAHEWLTQVRAVRFKLAAIAYVVLSAAPAVVVKIVAARGDSVIGPATYATALMLFQPMLTTLFAGALSIDAITREREESSFTVVSLAPLSAAGYVMHRWLAIVTLAIPVTMLPQLAGAALAVHSQGSPGGLMPFVWTWLLQVLPVLLVISATMLALGTIMGRPILAILAFAAALPISLGVLQDVLARMHRKLDGPGRFFVFDERAIQELAWTMRGYWSVPVATESGWPVEAAFDAMVPGALMAAAVACVLLGIAPAFLRRTKRDVRPWRIREDHPLRTFLKTMNRIREEYALDAGRQRADVAMFVLALLLAGGAFSALLARESHFADLAAQRFAAETGYEPYPMSESLIVRSARIEGTLGRTVNTRTTLVIENRGERPESYLAFTLHPALTLLSSRASSEGPGRVGRQASVSRPAHPGPSLDARDDMRITRVWDRVGIDLAEPLNPGTTRTITCELSGTPDEIEFSLLGNGKFKHLYNRYRLATRTVELSDLSRSRIVPAASRDRMLLAASDFTLVPRYETPNDPPALIETNLRTTLMSADSCGSTGTELRSRCTLGLKTYTVAGARMRRMPLTPSATLLHLDRHEALARTHAPALGEALAMAERAWPGVIDARGVFVERPTKPGERSYWWREDEAEIDSSGVLHLVPETMFIRREPMPAGVIAASMVSSALLGRRAVSSSEQWFFARFYEEAARARLGGESRSATVSRNASNQKLLEIGINLAGYARLRAVLADLEYRVGADRVAEGIGDFVGMPGEGNGRQLIDAIAKRADADLDRFYADFFAGEALPQLTFKTVTFARTAGGWEARGTLRNEGTGEVFCPIVLRTEHGSLKRVIRIGSDEAIPFAIPTPYAPRTLQLDPDRVCYRVSKIGVVESVEYRGAA